MTRLTVLFLCLAFSHDAAATWSVIAVDQQTGSVVIASATCVTQARFASFPADGLMDIQAIVVPGKGIAAAQAGVDPTRANQQLIREELQKGTAPDEILGKLRLDPAIEKRQFGIVSSEGKSIGYSGADNGAASVDVQGRVSGTEISFSIQGNILASDAVVHAAVSAFNSATGTLSDRAMAAMEAADASGGDRRCSCETPPLTAARCDGKTSHVSYLLQAEPGSLEDEPTIYLDVTDENIRPEENANPVKTLRMRYDALQKEP